MEELLKELIDQGIITEEEFIRRVEEAKEKNKKDGNSLVAMLEKTREENDMMQETILGLMDTIVNMQGGI